MEKSRRGRKVGKAEEKRGRGSVGGDISGWQGLCALPSVPGVSTCYKARGVDLGGTL